jgi:hypothetical protein
LLAFKFSTHNHIHISLVLPHTQPTYFSLMSSPSKHLVRNATHEGPYNVISSIPLLHPPSSAQIWYTVQYFQMPSLVSQVKLHTQLNKMQYHADAHPEFFIVGGGAGCYPEAIYNLCLNLKIML